MGTRYILKLNENEDREIAGQSGETWFSDCPLPAGSEVIAPTLADAVRMVAGGAYSWVEGQPVVDPGL